MEIFDHIIVGGGVLGLSVAYHLARDSQGSVLVLERNEPASAASSKAAGLILQATSKPVNTPLAKLTLDTIPMLEKELDEIVTLHEGGQPKRMTKREAIIKQFVNLAIKGNAKPLQMMLAHLEENRQPEPFVPSEADDAEILRAFGQAGAAGVTSMEGDDGDS